MNEIAKVKKEVKLSKWAEMVRQRNEGGLTVTDRCKENGTNLKTYYYRLKRVRQTVCSEIEQHDIVPVGPTAGTEITAEKIELSVGDIKISLPDDFNESTLKRTAMIGEEDGFVLLYKRLENGKYKWPRDCVKAKQIIKQKFCWLMEGLSIEQKTAIKPAKSTRPYKISDTYISVFLRRFDYRLTTCSNMCYSISIADHMTSCLLLVLQLNCNTGPYRSAYLFINLSHIYCDPAQQGRSFFVQRVENR